VKLHDLRPAAGARRERTRVGRGIAAGKGKTAGRGTKGQKARSGTSIPAWFEGGQTPIHVRVPKLRGFRNRGRLEYQVVNVGAIAAYAEAGRFGVQLEAHKPTGRKAAVAPADAPLTVNAEVLAQAGLVRSPDKPVKVLGEGEVNVKLFVAADAFTASARSKIEAAGGFVQSLAPIAEPDSPAAGAPTPEAEMAAQPTAEAEPAAAPAATPAKARRARKPARSEPEETAGAGESTEGSIT
jgi:large subunit ribosomal protein L15